MRVSRRSLLSRITSDDEWLEGPWWEDGSIGATANDPEEERRRLHGPQLARPATPAPGAQGDKASLIDPRLVAGREAKRSRRRNME